MRCSADRTIDLIESMETPVLFNFARPTFCPIWAFTRIRLYYRLMTSMITSTAGSCAYVCKAVVQGLNSLGISVWIACGLKPDIILYIYIYITFIIYFCVPVWHFWQLHCLEYHFKYLLLKYRFKIYFYLFNVPLNLEGMA